MLLLWELGLCIASRAQQRSRVVPEAVIEVVRSYSIYQLSNGEWRSEVPFGSFRKQVLSIAATDTVEVCR